LGREPVLQTRQIMISLKKRDTPRPALQRRNLATGREPGDIMVPGGTGGAEERRLKETKKGHEGDFVLGGE